MTGDVVIQIEHRPVIGTLVAEDVGLGLGVLLHGVVVVQVVGGQIGDHGDVGALLHGHQLEGGQLQHGVIVVLHAGHIGQQRAADVAAHIDVLPRLLQKLGDQGGGGGFAVAAGHAHQSAGAQLEEQLHFGGEHAAVLHSLLHLRRVGTEAGGAEDQIELIQLGQIVRAQTQAGAQALQLPGLF